MSGRTITKDEEKLQVPGAGGQVCEVCTARIQEFPGAQGKAGSVSGTLGKQDEQATSWCRGWASPPHAELLTLGRMPPVTGIRPFLLPGPSSLWPGKLPLGQRLQQATPQALGVGGCVFAHFLVPLFCLAVLQLSLEDPGLPQPSKQPGVQEADMKTCSSVLLNYMPPDTFRVHYLSGAVLTADLHAL